MRYLGLDLGSKTLGVATSDNTKTIASSLKTIFFKDEDYDSLIPIVNQLVKEYSVEKIILGFPKNMDNSIGSRAEIALSFKEKIEDKINIEVVMQDERLTSVISNNILINADISRKKRKKKVDGLAAQVILQSYLDYERNGFNG